MNQPKFPPFWKENPQLWFIQVESVFDILKITSDATKYRHVVASLDTQTLPYVSDILTTPPATEKCQAIKTRIINTFAETSEAKLRKLLRGESCTGEKPSILLQKIKNLADGQCNNAVLKSIFLEQLPEQVRGILAISEVNDLDRLALQADKIVESIKGSNNMIAATSDSSQKGINDFTELKVMISSMSKEVGALKRQLNRQNRSRSKSRNRSQDRDKNNDNFCFYHDRFGEKATKFRPPCAYPGDKKAGNQ